MSMSPDPAPFGAFAHATGARPARSVAWWRSSPVKPGMPVRDAAGAHVGKVAAVALGADGEVEAIEISVTEFGAPIARKRAPVDRVRMTSSCLVMVLYRRELQQLPDCDAR